MKAGKIEGASIAEVESCLLAQAARGISRNGHRSALAASRRIGRDLGWAGIRQTDSRIQFEVLFSARGAVAFPRVLIAQASKLIAPADAITVPGLRSRLDGN